MENMTFLTAFAAGVVSFVSPCVLPILPTYFSFLAGSGTGEKRQWKFVVNTLFFMFGFTLVFLVMGATASFFGQLFYQHQEILRKVGAVFMVAMGIHLLGIIPLYWLQREYRPFLNQTFQGPFGACLLGMAFTAGWTPCTGPILAAILAYAGAAHTLMYGVGLLFCYSLGFAVPFVILAFIFGRYAASIASFFVWLPFIQKAAGFVLILIGILLFFDKMQSMLGLISDINY